jgi:hypothetical protein
LIYYESSWRHHCIVLPFALLAGDFGAVKRFCQLSIRVDRPSEQVGKHHRGTGGCLASGDSGGIRAGATDSGSELAGCVAQPLASSIGTRSASTSNRSFFLSMGSSLLLRRGASLFLLPGTPLAYYLSQAVTIVTFRHSRCGVGTLYRSAVLICHPV